MDPLNNIICILPQNKDTYTNMSFNCQQMILGSTHKRSFINCKFSELIVMEFSSEPPEETFVGCTFQKLIKIRGKGGTCIFVRCIFNMDIQDITDLCYDCEYQYPYIDNDYEKYIDGYY